MKLIKGAAQTTVLLIMINGISFSHAAKENDVVIENSSSHFHPQGKLPSKFTMDFYKKVQKILPFDDRRDVEESKKGFIDNPPYQKIMADAGNVAWDMPSYNFLLQGKEFTSIHSSLQR